MRALTNSKRLEPIYLTESKIWEPYGNIIEKVICCFTITQIIIFDFYESVLRAQINLLEHHDFSYLPLDRIGVWHRLGFQ